MGRASRAPLGLLFFVFRQTFGQLLANFRPTFGHFWFELLQVRSILFRKRSRGESLRSGIHARNPPKWSTFLRGPKGPGPLGPLKKVASLRETARLVNPKIAQSWPKVCQKLTKSLPKYKKQQTQWGARSAPHSDRSVYYFGKLLVNFWQTFG